MGQSRSIIASSTLSVIIGTIRERFNQPGYRVLKQLECLLLKAAKKE